jgi:hypothetical protein
VSDEVDGDDPVIDRERVDLAFESPMVGECGMQKDDATAVRVPGGVVMDGRPG